MRTLLAALVAVFLCLPAFAQDQCLDESAVDRRVTKAYPAVGVQERIDGDRARLFSAYIEERFGVPATGDLVVQYGVGSSATVYVVFFKDGCMVHDSFVKRARYGADKAKALGSGV